MNTGSAPSCDCQVCLRSTLYQVSQIVFSNWIVLLLHYFGAGCSEGKQVCNAQRTIAPVFCKSYATANGQIIAFLIGS